MTGFLKWITFLFGAAQALGLRKVRGEAWQGFKRPAKPEVTHTRLRDGNDSAFQNTHTVCQCYSFYSDLTCDVTFHPADEVEKRRDRSSPNFLQKPGHQIGFVPLD